MQVRPLAWMPRLTTAVLAAPVLAGVAGTILPGLGYLPALGGDAVDFAPWSALIASPGLARSAATSLFTGLAATAISLAFAVLILAGWSGTAQFRFIRRALSPILSIPHAAAAFGLAFLIAPSGWLVRGVSPWLTGWDAPPDWLVPGDPLGLTLIAGLVLKETPFLLLMMLSALAQVNAAQSVRVGLSLGYDCGTVWLKAVLPRIYPQIRKPVLAVLAYSISNIETAIILGPSTPPTLAVRVTEWMRSRISRSG